jgi:hypothetical protein
MEGVLPEVSLDFWVSNDHVVAVGNQLLVPLVFILFGSKIQVFLQVLHVKSLLNDGNVLVQVVHVDFNLQSLCPDLNQVKMRNIVVKVIKDFLIPRVS